MSDERQTDRSPQRAPDAAATGPPTLGEVIEDIGSEIGEGDRGPATAATAPAGPDSSPLQQVVLFSQSSSRFAARIDWVYEVGPVPTYTWVPGVPPWIMGVANFRGEILSVVDLGELLGLAPSPAPGSRRMIVARSSDASITAGLVVDRVHGEARVPESRIQPQRAAVDDRIAPYLAGTFDSRGHTHGLLDLERLLLSDEFRPLGRAGG